ncbi:acyl-CoA thioesterase-1 [Paracoccus halophilus]|uniref:Acyl-CoA thioesterase-1 n=1 Tax=Paracoccus halophilus TaxID=376733 RepID=A0A099F856_9RHOB|nr:arylesterase [Paracoccus halophilus]KGJ06689.1 GDSL family lipase [Paracoccus halophilus]SFA42171.1 acyl-CoA thioesterase-1 [Paracoccus halophilus]
MKLLVLVLSILLAATPVAADTIRILAFGDSLTEGYGLPRRDGLVPQLRNWLQARGHDVTVLNGGLSGDTTAGGRVRIGYSIARHRPDAVIVELGGNDLLLGFSPALVEDNLDSILDQAGRDGKPLLLVGIASPDHDASQRREWLEIWPRLARRHDALLMENLYQPLFDLPGEGYKTMLQDDGLHASAEGVALIVESLGPRVEELIARTEAVR